MRVCLTHSWNQPCIRCALDERILVTRLSRIWDLGGIARAVSNRKRIHVATAKRKRQWNGLFPHGPVNSAANNSYFAIMEPDRLA